jgi:hypothetical protein
LSEGKLTNVKTGEGFKFTTQQAYEDLGDAMTEEVYRLMEQYGGLVRMGIPLDSDPGDENTSFIFVTPNVLHAHKSGERSVEKVLILIHGSGAVRAGQWARRLNSSWFLFFFCAPFKGSRGQ